MVSTLDSSKIEELIRITLNKPGEGDIFLEEAKERIRDRCRKDLWFLCYYVLGYNDIDTALHRDMCRRWEKRRRRRFTIWQTPRFHLKTSIWTIGGTIQEFLIDPNTRALIVNAVATNAAQIFSEIKTHFETNEVLRWLFPEYCIDLAPDKKRAKLCTWTYDRIDFPCGNRIRKKEGNLQYLGVEMSLVSMHYDYIVYDDPVNDINCSTSAYRNKIHNWFRNSLQLRHDLTTSRVRLVGTDWHFDDLYSRTRKAEMKRRAAGKRARWLQYRRVVVEYNPITKRDEPIWPERFNLKKIAELKTELGSYIFNCQFMLNPNPEDEAIFPASKLRVISALDLPDKLLNFCAVDLAEEETKGDFTAITVAGFDSEGDMYVRYIMRGKVFPLDIVDTLHNLCKIYDIKQVAIETVGFQRTFIKFYQRYAAQHNFYIPFIEMNRGKTHKFKRHLSLQPIIESGKFHLLKGMPHLDDAIEELVTCPNGAHDDILDTLADIHAIYYEASPQDTFKGPPPNSLDAIYGPLDTVDDDYDMVGGAFIGNN